MTAVGVTEPSAVLLPGYYAILKQMRRTYQASISIRILCDEAANQNTDS